MKIQQTRRRRWLTGTISLGLLVGIAGAGVHAQGAPGAAPNARTPDFRNLTREQRQQIMTMTQNYLRDLTLKMMLTNAGFTDKQLQNAVVTFSNDQGTAVQPLRDQEQNLMVASSSQDSTDAEVAAQLAAFQTAVANEDQRRKTALDALDAQINYSKQPKLAAVLTVMGLTGDEMAVADGGGAMMGGRGGRGGRGAGGRGGRGGAGGGGAPGGGAPAAPPPAQ